MQYLRQARKPGKLRAEAHDRDPASFFIIDGTVYSAGNEPAPGSRNWLMLGFGGRRVEIESIASGARTVSHNLWYGGTIPERLRERMPDNARFIYDQRMRFGGER